MSISTISILLSLAWLVPSLRNKKALLCWAGFAFAVVIMFTRMVLGAHYLSDVSAGALLGLVLVFLNDALQRRIGSSAQ
jgi:membrane-associated phospholipid phosphatase